MPEENIFPWDVALWRRDPKVTVLPTLARGVWRELLDVMHESDRSGVITGTREEIARLGRCSAVELDQTIHELCKHKTADVTERNGIVTIINRKMRREHNARKSCRLRVDKHRNGSASGAGNAGVTTPLISNDKDDKALSPLSLNREGDRGNQKPETKNSKRLTEPQRELAQRFEIVLGPQWTNDAGKWINRIKAEPGKTERVLAEVESATKENRVRETPAQYCASAAASLFGNFSTTARNHFSASSNFPVLNPVWPRPR